MIRNSVIQCAVMIHHFLSRVMCTCFWSLKVHPRRKKGGPNLIITTDSKAIIGVTTESTNYVLEWRHCNLLVRKFHLPPGGLRHLQTDWGQGDRGSIPDKGKGLTKKDLLCKIHTLILRRTQHKLNMI